MTFWMENKKSEPQLCELANIIFAAAPTQVSVERAFSGLAFVLNPHRTCLGEDKFSNIMILRLKLISIVYYLFLPTLNLRYTL